MFPLGNDILMKMWQHFLEWTLVDGWSNGVTLIACKRQQTIWQKKIMLTDKTDEPMPLA